MIYQDSHVRSGFLAVPSQSVVDRGLMFQFSAGERYAYHRDLGPLLVEGWTSANYATEKHGSLIFNRNNHGFKVSGTSAVNMRAGAMTVLVVLLTEASSNANMEFTGAVTMSASNTTAGMRWSTSVGYADISWPTVAARAGVNVIAFAVPAQPTVAADFRFARNGVVAGGSVTFENTAGAAYGVPVSTLGIGMTIARNSTGQTAIVKIWDRQLSDSELRALTADPFNHGLSRARSMFTTAPTVLPLVVSCGSSHDVGGTITASRGSTHDVQGSGVLNSSCGSSHDIFYEMMAARGSYQSIRRSALPRSPIDLPADGSYEAQILLPDWIRISRYEDVLADRPTTRFRYTSGVNTVFSLARS